MNPSLTATCCIAVDDATAGVRGVIGHGALIDVLTAVAGDLFEARRAGALNANVRLLQLAT